MPAKQGIYKIDYILITAMALLVGLGILMIYSAGFDPIDEMNSGLYRRQILWFIIGFVLLVAMTFVSYQQLGDYSLQVYGVMVVILLLTALFGAPIRNIRAWISFGFFSIQPSEFMKLALVLVLAKYLEVRERDIKNLRELLVPSLLTLLPVAIILKQPDFGTAMLFFPILFTMLFLAGADVAQLMSILFIAGIALVVPMILTYLEWVGATQSNIVIDFLRNTKTLLIVSGVLLLISLFTYLLNLMYVKKYLRRIYVPSTVVSLGLFFSVVIQNIFKDYQKKRILVFLNTDLDPHGSAYNIIQSKIAIGSGGFLGKGFLQGTQSQLGFLPEKTSDFIFAVVAEEWGFIGSVLVLLLMGVIIFRGIQIALEAKDTYGALVASGITSIFFFHLLINIGMTVGIMPVTGLPLCFVSYGGSNLLMAMLGVGILINIRMRKFVY